MDTCGAAWSPSRGGLWCSAVKIPAHRSQVFKSILSFVLTGSYRPCSKQAKLFLFPTQHKLSLHKLAPFWARWPEKASPKDQFKVGHVTRFWDLAQYLVLTRMIKRAMLISLCKCVNKGSQLCSACWQYRWTVKKQRS